MNRKHLRWLINPVFLLAAATCNNEGGQVQGGMCQSGADTDSDGLTDDIECRIGSDPNNPDTNGDGISDGDAYNLGLDPTKLDSDGDGVPDAVELAYPKICLANERNDQRRPVQVCTATSECQAGEQCKGLDPLSQDTDGDGVLDKDEDPDLNGTIDFSVGESDPRLWDTDGNGANDAESGAQICFPDGLGKVTQKGLGPIQLGHDPVFGTAKDATGVATGKNTGIVDDAATGVAGVVVVETTRGTDERADAAAYEGDIQTKLGTGMVAVLVGKPFKTHEALPAIHSTYLYTASAATSASAIRDSLVPTLSGGTAPGGATAGSGNTTFYLDITTVRRTAGLDDLIIAISPTNSYNDTTKSTAIRVDDLTNATDVAQGDRTLDHACQGIIANRQPTVDFLWTVDVSGSMDDNQALVGNASTTFAQRLTSAGVDYRVGIFAAEGNPANAIDLTQSYTTGNATIDNGTVFPDNGWKNGFSMLQSTTLLNDRWMCRFVTATKSGSHGYCPADTNMTNDPYSPFGINDGADAREEPAAAAVRLTDILKKNMTNTTVTNASYKWRQDATKAFFFATDEFANANDWGRYFKTAKIAAVERSRFRFPCPSRTLGKCRIHQTVGLLVAAAA